MPNENKMVFNLETGEWDIVEVSDEQQAEIMAQRADTTARDELRQEETDAKTAIDALVAGIPPSAAEGAALKKKLGLE